MVLPPKPDLIPLTQIRHKRNRVLRLVNILLRTVSFRSRVKTADELRYRLLIKPAINRQRLHYLAPGSSQICRRAGESGVCGFQLSFSQTNSRPRPASAAIGRTPLCRGQPRLCAGGRGSAQMTGDQVAGADLTQCRDLALAPRLGIGAARMEGAARGRVDRTRNIALQQVLLALDPWIGDRDRSQRRPMLYRCQFHHNLYFSPSLIHNSLLLRQRSAMVASERHRQPAGPRPTPRLLKSTPKVW